ncbi:hypothetical protein C8Q72DRAFT_958852 [Fomitopsis betulina]|nr:hypothetical protein C8Q72DRAFT_958852 [Fomitopsis betulina]
MTETCMIWPTIFEFGRLIYLYSPTTILKLGVNDGEDEYLSRDSQISALRCAPAHACAAIPLLRPSPPPTIHVLYNEERPVRAHACCSSRAQWDDTRLRSLRASDMPAQRLPILERVQRETTGADEWGRPVVTHVDLSDRNILVDPDTLAMTGLLDWERANIMPAYYEYVAARLTEAHLPEWRKELLDVLRMVLRRECGVKCGEVGEAGELSEDADSPLMTLAAWDAMVEVERPAQGYDEDCYWTFETGYPDSDTELDGARKVRA